MGNLTNSGLLLGCWILSFPPFLSISIRVTIPRRVAKIRVMNSQKWNRAASFPIPTFMYLWASYIFPGSVWLFGCSKIGRPIYKWLTDTWMWKLGDRTLYFCFGNIEAVQFHFLEDINRNQTFIFDLTGPPFTVRQRRYILFRSLSIHKLHMLFPQDT
jgi:hypothetical protein